MREGYRSSGRRLHAAQPYTSFLRNSFHDVQVGKTQQPTIVTKDMAKSLFDKVRRSLKKPGGENEGCPAKAPSHIFSPVERITV